MSGHPINQAIIAQLLFDLRNGQLRRALDMGFTEEDLALLQDPEMLSVLINSSVRWSTVSVNSEVMRRLLGRVKDSDKEIQMIDLMLKYGASSKLLAEAFGLDPREVALRKRVKGIDKKQGRWQEITEEQDHQLWREWQVEQALMDKLVEEDSTALIKNLLNALKDSKPSLYFSYPENSLKLKAQHFIENEDYSLDLLAQSFEEYLVQENE